MKISKIKTYYENNRSLKSIFSVIPFKLEVSNTQIIEAARLKGLTEHFYINGKLDQTLFYF